MATHDPDRNASRDEVPILGIEERPAENLPSARRGTVVVAGLVILLVAALAFGLGRVSSIGPSETIPRGPDVPISEIPDPTTAPFEPALSDPAPTTTAAPTEAELLSATRLSMAEIFRQSIGRGEAHNAEAMLHPRSGQATVNLTGYLSAFRSEILVLSCEDFAANAARCEIEIRNTYLAAIGMGSARQDVFVIFEDGAPERLLLTPANPELHSANTTEAIVYFDTPMLIGSSGVRLEGFARDRGMPEWKELCDPAIYPEDELLGYGAAAATPECGAFLFSLVGDYLDSR